MEPDMRSALAALSMLAVSLGSRPLAAADVPGRAEFVPTATDEVLFNPGMGLYLQYPPLDAKADEWFMGLCDIAYYRLDWSEVNPEPDVYRFDEYFGPHLDAWVGTHGKRVAFRVMCQNMHSASDFVTPKWVFDRGVPGVEHRALRGQMQTNPAFWDERYLEQHLPFIEALGRYLDGREGLEFVDIGSIGEWGEMHLARWTSEQFETTGYTHARYVQAYRRVIDAFADAFPRTRVFLNVGGPENQTINDYAALRGLHFRQDGLKPDGASYHCEEWLYPPYARRGVLCNLEFHSGYTEMLQRGWDVATTLDKALSSPVSYLNTNLFGGPGYRQAPEDVRQLLTAVGRRLGFRFVLARLEHPTVLRVAEARRSRVLLQAAWRNEGIAPCYASYALDWFLLAADGKEVVRERVFPRTPTTQWWPGEEQSTEVCLRLPPGTPAGEYLLAVAMIDPETGQRIRLGFAGRDETGRYPLCVLPAVTVAAAPTLLIDEGFEAEPLATWHGAKGVSANVVADSAHAGTRALRVSGTSKGTWNYATARLPAGLPPGSRVRLSGWLRVDDLQGTRRGPYLKIGVNDPEGRWLTNLNTAAYDLAAMGAWQRLQGIGEVPAKAGSADLAIERGEPDAEIHVDLRLDDVQVDVLEAP
jgi:hypothetical protein